MLDLLLFVLHSVHNSGHWAVNLEGPILQSDHLKSKEIN